MLQKALGHRESESASKSIYFQFSEAPEVAVVPIDEESAVVKTEQKEKDIKTITDSMLANADDQIELVLRCLLGMCSGQNTELQARKRAQYFRDISILTVR